MPTISVGKAALFDALGRSFTTEEFENLCFDYGIELDEDTTDLPRPTREDGTQAPPELKIEIPANRYDMLCFEGIAMALNIFLGRREYPKFTLKVPQNGKMHELRADPSTSKVRPFCAGAILRGVQFDQARYDSFISLQDKLHQNLARQRTLVAIGTHDLDKIKGPHFSYAGLPSSNISFVPLNQNKEMTATQMMQFYEKDKHLSRYLHIIKDSPVYPVIFDERRTVLSMPPIINGDVSKITLETRNVFIDTTATDRTKLDIVISEIVAMFSEYCAEPFTIEPVKVVSDHNGQSRITPDMSARDTTAEVDYIAKCIGIPDLKAHDICKLLRRMGYAAAPSRTAPQRLLDVKVPVTRADVLHQADIMEDVAVAYGYNNLPRTFPHKAATIAAPLPLNKLADLVRVEAAMSGWTEVLPLILCSHEENFGWMNRKDDGTTAIRLANPKTSEYQIVRTSLVPGLLKCARENKHHAVPMRLFEVSDVAFKDPTRERKTRNERHLAALWYGKASGFEMVHGLLDREMRMLSLQFLLGQKRQDENIEGYWIEERWEDPTFLKGHSATIKVRQLGTTRTIGEFGILHPSVLKKYELP
ncbi:MAG: hypothetical protein Q9159_006426 [Coniocarpon cinnabarinum]